MTWQTHVAKSASPMRCRTNGHNRGWVVSKAEVVRTSRTASRAQTKVLTKCRAARPGRATAHRSVRSSRFACVGRRCIEVADVAPTDEHQPLVDMQQSIDRCVVQRPGAWCIERDAGGSSVQ